MKKNVGLGLFVLIHFYYCLRLFCSPHPSGVILAIAGLLSISYIWGFDHFPHNTAVDGTKIFPSMLSAMVGGLLCSVMSLKTGPVLACGTVGYAASFSQHVFKGDKYHELPYSTYCGCFVGMSSSAVIPNLGLVALIGAVSGLVFATTKRSLEGVGGKLGCIAFGCVSAYMLISSIR